MEDDDSDTSVTKDEPVPSERPLSSATSTVAHNDNVSECISPTLLERIVNAKKPECEDMLKSRINQDISDSANSSAKVKLISESDVPKSPKKVNGEVKFSMCETDGQKSDLDVSSDITGAERIGPFENSDSELKDADLEPGNMNSVKYKLNYSLISETKDAVEDCQNSEGEREYKGFKKKIIAQASVTNNTKDNSPVSEDPSLNSSKSLNKCKAQPCKNTLSSESQHILVSHQPLPDGTQSSAQLTEYAQYLGLQPTVKFKCYKCGESGFPSMLRLQEHQKICLKNINKMQSLSKPTPPASSLSEATPSTNFRITRKVYLCSACGTYYENWNLFLHMREVHKRHICLFCLGMFSQADKLATHLAGKHGVPEGLYTSSDQFICENKGSCFLMCCTCERIFTERENFFDHSCSEGLIINAEKACSLCGLRGAHFPTCRRAFTDSSTSPPPSTPPPPPQPPSGSTFSATVENQVESVQNSDVGDQERNISVTKYLIPVAKIQSKVDSKDCSVHENVEENQEKSRDLSDFDDDYDISNAASFCHVNIHEPQEKQKSNTVSQLKTYIGKNHKPVTNKVITEKIPPPESPDRTKENHDNEKSVESDDNIQHKTETDPQRDKEHTIPEEEERDKNEKIEECRSTCNKNCVEAREPADAEHNKEMKHYSDNLESRAEENVSEEIENPEVETKEISECQENDSQPELLEDTTSEPKMPTEENEKSAPREVTSPESLSKIGSALIAKTTEAETESESSDSGGESDSSSSSEASEEDSDHEEVVKREEKALESDIDNADSDKMSLIVDENQSEEETEKHLQTTEEEKDSKELKEDRLNNSTQNEQKNGDDVMDTSVDVTEDIKSVDEEKCEEQGESIQLAGDEVPPLELTLEENLDTMSIQMLLKESVKVSCLNCVYCNHAKKIAVNGKQLALHLLAEHRFAAVVCSDSGELTEADGFVDKLKTSLSELQHMFFNTDSYDNMDPSCMQPYDRTYECFHCHFLTTLHKELYVHNRKMHQKTILLCIMCKSNFYSYSELLCHMCPGIYVPDSNISFRCCICTVDGLPSAFRLMVHLRKRHHACDVCLETTGDQQKLSNHVWKHKLHHLCYRCGIAYRNKPDITKHLFWKHGTESVLCKKCLQKKWPHVYHFCIPPNAFVCEECNSSFSRAVALKVHKRLHVGDLPYPCDECEERFISKKLLIKHQGKHLEPLSGVVADSEMQESGQLADTSNLEEEEDKLKADTVQEIDKVAQECSPDTSSDMKKKENVDDEPDSDLTPNVMQSEADKIEIPSITENLVEDSKNQEKDTNEKKAKILDVYDLPPLNLSSESDDSDDERENVSKEPPSDIKSKKTITGTVQSNINTVKQPPEKNIPETVSQSFDDAEQPVQIVDGVWENFKTYKANLERRENHSFETSEVAIKINESVEEMISVINMDHDYCCPPAETSQPEQSEGTSRLEEKVIQDTLSPLVETENLEEKDKTEEDLKACDADHNYCYTNTTSLPVEEEKEIEQTSEPPSSLTPSKKKQKSPKKKLKRSASSSSSDSSSNSDSSTCSCGTNCSCSSSSSSSSGSSSSQSSDSDSSSSEGRRRQAARRERRRERGKKRKTEETDEVPQPPPPESPKTEAVESATNGPQGCEEILPSVEPDESELPVRESDLDTDETETDEDFYDKYPQKLANKLLAEKRNQLLLLAAVAPVNNGTMTQSCQSPSLATVEEPVPKKKIKTKKHKKSHQLHINVEEKTEGKMKLNIPTDYYSTQTPANASSTNSLVNPSLLTTPTHSVPSPFLPEPSTPTTTYQSTGSGSETDSKRLSKRKRVPKRFYGDSSDEEHEQPAVKWRKVSTTASNSPASSTPSAPAFTYKSTPVTVIEPVYNPPSPAPVNEEKSDEEVADDSDSDREDTKKSSTESSNSESEADKDEGDDEQSDADSDIDMNSTVQTNPVSATRESDNMQQKNENLYCYCQCPYDEVSEMIACDGKDCTIEWFHFECVGIMVPPKGKWFCPDCRKRAAARSEYLLHT